jgi:SAM-dependent methyltransferase
MVMPVCPYCKSSKVLKSYFIAQDKIRRCKACDLIYRDNPISDNDILTYYRKHYYGQWGIDQENCFRDNIYLDVLARIERLGKRGRLLDIGAGNGHFLALAQKHGWKIQGQEISTESCQLAREKYGIQLRNETLREMKWGQNQFNVITLLNVLDHLTDPWQLLEKAFVALKKRGLIYVRIPNGNLHSLFYRIADSIPIALIGTKLNKFSVMHHYHFTPRFVSRLLRVKGFVCVVIRNSKFSKVKEYPSFNKLENSCLMLLKKSMPTITNITYRLSKGRFLLSPSIDIYAVKP